MIKKLNNKPHILPTRSYEWVETEEEPEDLFLPRPSLRKLKVVIDYDLIENLSDIFDKSFLLKGLLDHKFIEYYKYSDKGPYGDALQVEKNTGYYEDLLAYKDWINVSVKPHEGHLPVVYAKDERITYSSIFFDGPEIAFRDESSKAYLHLNENEGSIHRRNDMIALSVANQVINADIFITNREYLYSSSNLVKNNNSVTLCTVEEAIPLISLYLRAQNVFIKPTGYANFIFSYGKWGFYWVGTRELLPEAWRWFSACVHNSSTTKDDTLTLLGGSLLNRVCRALQSRDKVHIAVNKATTTDSIEDALNSLDTTLTLLMGAVDVTARVVHLILKMPNKPYEAAWQKDKWYSNVCSIEPNLTSLFPGNSVNDNTLTILRLLRNSVHGTALQGITTVFGMDQKRMMVMIPKDDESHIIQAMESMGGKENWGFKPIIPGRTYIEPEVLVDRLFEYVVKMLNSILKETPVERLNFVGKLLTDPPIRDNGFDNFSEDSRKNIRWQLGF